MEVRKEDFRGGVFCGYLGGDEGECEGAIAEVES